MAGGRRRADEVGELDELADAVAAVLDAPITIEDLSSRVLAYSRRQDHADRARIETILARRMPSHYTRQLEADGVFARLYRSDRPVYLGGDDSYCRRAAIRVSAGEEIFGTIWATLAHPLTPERERALITASRTVALHLLHARDAAPDRRRVAALMTSVLHAAPDAATAATVLGLPPGPACVLALSGGTAHPAGGRAEAGRDPEREAERQAAARAFAARVAGARHPGVAADLGAVTYAILPVPGGDADAVRLAARALDDVPGGAGGAAAGATGGAGRGHPGVVIAVGGAAPTLRDLPRSRADADRTLRVLRTADRPRRRVARFADVQAEAVLLELGDRMAAEGPARTGPVATLMAHDDAHGTDLTATLRAWLDAFGDVNAAAAARHVHPNTIRYRLRKLTKLSGLDLTDPEQRFAAQLLLRLAPST